MIYRIGKLILLTGLAVLAILALKQGKNFSLKNTFFQSQSDKQQALNLPISQTEELEKQGIKVIDNRFLIKGNFPQDKLKAVINDLKDGIIDRTDLIQYTPEATSQELVSLQSLTESDQKTNENNTNTCPYCQNNNSNNSNSTNNNSGSGDNYGDTYCPLNKVLSGQCGGDKNQRDKYRHVSCKSKVSLAYYEDCNYGNKPKIVNDPRDYTDACHSIDYGNCNCGCIVMSLGDNCGPVLTCMRLIGNICVAMPHSCEQCCAGGAWLYDEETGGCACQW